MGTLADMLGIVDLAYEAALAPQSWPQVLESMADAAQAHGAALLFQDQVNGRGKAIVARLDPSALSLQFGYYATRNPIRHGRNRVLGLRDAPESWRTRVITNEDAMPKAELVRSEFYNDFLRHFAIHSGMMVGLALEDTRFATINLFRPPGRDQFGASEIEFARHLQPHLIRAFELGLKLSDAQQLHTSLAHALDHSQHGIFLADRAARVSYVNRTGEALVAQGRGLSVKGGILRTISAESSRNLHRLIETAGSADVERRSGGAISVARPACHRPLSIIVAPLRSEQLGFFAQVPSVIVCATDPETGIAVPEERLRALFAFTPAEAKTAIELLAGCDPASIAERKSVSVNTVRVHIARIMAKTDTNKQTELVRLLERVSGFRAE